MQTVTFNPLPAGARALTVDETAVVAGGIVPVLITIASAIGRAAAAGARHFGRSAAVGAGGAAGGTAGYHGMRRIIEHFSAPNAPAAEGD